MLNRAGLSLSDAAARVIAENPAFAVETAVIRGIEYPVFANAPAHVPALLDAGRAAMQDGTADYLVFGDETWTYDAFCTDVNRLAHVLRTRFGVSQGDRVALAMRNCPELMIGIMAIASLGAVTVFLNAWWTTAELDYALGDSGASLVLADAERARRLAPLEATVIGVRGAETAHDYSALMADAEAIKPDVNIAKDDDFAIMYSSGTTGHPKGVVQTHRSAISAVWTFLMQAVIAPLMDPPEPDAPPAPRPVGLVATPLFHVTATHPVFLLSIPAGAKLVVMDKWDADKAVELIEAHQINRFIGVPTQSADLIGAARKAGKSLDTIDYLGSGGAKRPPAQVAELAEAFPNSKPATGWGMTETNAVGIGLVGDEYVANPSVAGRLYPPIQALEIRDPDGHALPLGEVGELTVKSPANMREYLNKPEATAEVLNDGWLSTGDLGFIDETGLVTIVDRAKNIIIRGGENIACLDVEAALHRHPAVAEACAFSVPHARLGEVVGAGIQVKTGAQVTEEEMKTFLESNLAYFKIPAHMWFQNTPLPRGATDKLDRRGLRDACLKDFDHA
ncbi:MAG: class I adenylate-forming enzyme family protein [Pseudomonadota bacterium]